jgi:serine/threonine-protein kinase
VTCDGQADALESFQVRGKVGYLAPEQITDTSPDRRVDIFTLGTVLYLMTTGVHPFEGRGPLATLYNIGCDEAVTPPSKFRRDYPEELEAVVLRCLEKDKNRRFASCDELVWALDSSISSDLRATDQDVAVFVRSLAGHIGAERWKALELAAPDYGSVSRWPSVAPGNVDQQVAPLESEVRKPASIEPPIWLPDAPRPIDAASPSRPVPQSGRRRGRTNLLLWAAVFAVSIWMLISHTGVAPSSAATTSIVKPVAVSPCAYPAPTPSQPPLAQSNPERRSAPAGTRQITRPAGRHASDKNLLR